MKLDEVRKRQGLRSRMDLTAKILDGRVQGRPEAERVEVTATRDGATLQLKVRFRAAKDAGKAATTGEVQISYDG